MYKRIYLLTLAFMMMSVPAGAHIASTEGRPFPKTLVESFTPGFLEQRSCGFVNRNHRLSRNPLNINKPSNQSEVRLMVQTRDYECMAYAYAEVKEALEKSKLLPEQTQAYLNSARFWWRGGAERYTFDVTRVLNAGKTLVYLTGDDDYAWIYVAHGMASLKNGLKAAYGSLENAPVSVIVKEFLKGEQGLSGLRGGGGIPVATGQVYFDEHFFTDAPLAAERLAAMKRINQLHLEAGEALLCQNKTGVPCPGGRPSSVISPQFEAAVIDANVRLGIPTIIPFAKGVKKGISYEDLCVISQRTEMAHHAWVENMLQGHTPSGYRRTWFASLAHAILHTQRRTGEAILRTKSHDVNKFLTQPVPGVSSDGVCHLDNMDSPASCATVPLTPSLPDTFIRKDCSSLGNGWKVVTGELIINENTMINEKLSDDHMALLPSMKGADQIVTAGFKVTNGNNGPKFGVVLRYKNPGNYYLLYRQSGGTSVLRISKVVDGREIPLTSTPVGGLGANSSFRLIGKAQGSILTLQLDGKKISVSDATFSSGPVGTYIRSSGISQKATYFDAVVK